MKPCQRFLQGWRPILQQKYLMYHNRTILQYATDTSSSDTKPMSTEERSYRVTHQYPPPPLQDRYSKPVKKSGVEIEPYKDPQFKPKETKSNVPKAGYVPNDEQDSTMIDKQSPNPSSPGCNISENSIKFMFYEVYI